MKKFWPESTGETNLTLLEGILRFWSHSGVLIYEFCAVFAANLRDYLINAIIYRQE